MKGHVSCMKFKYKEDVMNKIFHERALRVSKIVFLMRLEMKFISSSRVQFFCYSNWKNKKNNNNNNNNNSNSNS